MDRWVTSPTCGPLPPCKQVLSQSRTPPIPDCIPIHPSVGLSIPLSSLSPFLSSFLIDLFSRPWLLFLCFRWTHPYSWTSYVRQCYANRPGHKVSHWLLWRLDSVGSAVTQFCDFVGLWNVINSTSFSLLFMYQSRAHIALNTTLQALLGTQTATKDSSYCYLPL